MKKSEPIGTCFCFIYPSHKGIVLSLIHIFIGLELTINEYLEKYAYPYKISRIIDTFKKKLDDLKMHADFAKRISESEAELEAVKEALNETARKKKELEEKKDKINAVSYTHLRTEVSMTGWSL